MSKLRFSDGMEFEPDGELRIEHRADGYYVVGEGFVIAVDSEAEGTEFIETLKNYPLDARDRTEALKLATYHSVVRDAIRRLDNPLQTPEQPGRHATPAEQGVEAARADARSNPYRCGTCLQPQPDTADRTWQCRCGLNWLVLRYPDETDSGVIPARSGRGSD